MADAPTLLPAQIILILCGLVGAGKSTFAASLVAYQPTKWVTCCQDELKTRSRVEARVREALDNGFSPIVDRTNITADQRATWVEIANEFEVPAYLLFLNTPPENCAERVMNRQDHPTVKTGAQGVGLIRSFGASFEAPTADEGFARVWSYVPPALQHALPASTGTSEINAGELSSSTAALPSTPATASIQSFFTTDELTHILHQLHLSNLEVDSPPLELSGPLPPPPPRKKKVQPPVKHGMDIRKCFPPKTGDASHRRAARVANGEGSTTGRETAGTSQGSKHVPKAEDTPTVERQQ